MRKIIEGDVNLRSLFLKELFDLSDVEVIDDFDCGKNNLTNLEDSPHTVGKSFWCFNNDLTNLKGSPHTVGRNFNCSGNNLTSLEGIPKTVGKDFYIRKELKNKFPEEYIRSMCKIKGTVVYV